MINLKDLIRTFYKKSIENIAACSPTIATQILYLKHFHKILNLRNPHTLNEKILWLKLNDYNNNPLVTMCADKYRVREYVKENGFSNILNKLYYVWESPSEIIWKDLPNNFVLKCNHGCGYNVICSDKSRLNRTETLKQINLWYQEDFWKKKAELNYKNIKKCVICEKYLKNMDGSPISDYKVYCFHGKALYILVCDNQTEDRKFYFYDTSWNFLRINPDGLASKEPPRFKKPTCLKEILLVSEKLSEPFPFVRVDFYIVNGKPVFGEMTFTPAAGLDTNRLQETDNMFGELLNIK